MKLNRGIYIGGVVFYDDVEKWMTIANFCGQT